MSPRPKINFLGWRPRPAAGEATFPRARASLEGFAGDLSPDALALARTVARVYALAEEFVFGTPDIYENDGVTNV